MRTNIYYWKCDNPLPVEEKLVYNDKYRLADISDLVRKIAIHHFSAEPLFVEAVGVSGNHYTYRIHYPDQIVFFRSDDGKIQDDYMDAEAVAIKLASEAGVPVPEVIATDTSMKSFPVRYQLLENVAGDTMSDLYQVGTLDRTATALQLGRYLGKLHNVNIEGFGFINTDELHKSGKVNGLNATNADYFNTRLEDHLQFLQDTQFLKSEEVHQIEELLKKYADHLELAKGSLVHKDIAYWNLVGTNSQINAIVDWDDVISGDPIDDLAVVRCFYQDDVFLPMLEGYGEVRELPDDFEVRLALYLIRNMLWKTVFRTNMKYFDFKEKEDLLNRDEAKSLKQFTYERLYQGIDALKKL